MSDGSAPVKARKDSAPTGFRFGGMLSIRWSLAEALIPLCGWGVENSDAIAAPPSPVREKGGDEGCRRARLAAAAQFSG